ncbi:glycosyltransferase [Arthrobacter alpinus]|uniref:glycosyltransferase n=1 Tax=Arthrobacter alpinus TaxID=656366 RepID=UPI0009FB6A2B|nr:glycosyltransferase [Arthrobacter alpinus]
MKFQLEASKVNVLYLAVLPKYRTECMFLLDAAMGENLEIYVSSSHLDRSVKTGIPSGMYRDVRMVRIVGGRAFIQYGYLGRAITASTTIVDLNPRSVTAWVILICRRILNRRSLVWGHIHPRVGAQAKTAFLRRAMRRMASGTISYTYSDAQKAANDLTGSQVWTAPNSLYLEKDIHPKSSEGLRNSVIYVGRFEETKKVGLLVEGFAKAAQMYPDIRLALIGGGSQEMEIRNSAEILGIAERVDFLGWIDDLETLRNHYDSAFCSASPGFAGLGLTQSLGFGVPMVVARSEPHSPEIELDSTGGVHYFESDSPESLAAAIGGSWSSRAEVPNLDFSSYVRKSYSAEAMASGLENAILGRQSKPELREF